MYFILWALMVLLSLVHKKRSLNTGQFENYQIIAAPIALLLLEAILWWSNIQGLVDELLHRKPSWQTR